jgi:hypothetical protein
MHWTVEIDCGFRSETTIYPLLKGVVFGVLNVMIEFVTFVLVTLWAMSIIICLNVLFSIMKESDCYHTIVLPNLTLTNLKNCLILTPIIFTVKLYYQ